MNEKEKLKSLLLQLLDKFVEVCEANGLKYYLAYGSVLGAVRHQGLIPWDDDIDVCMMRKDYETLQKLPASIWGENYRLCSWKNTKHYAYHILKLEKQNSTLIELFRPIYVGGVYLDIFPLDNVPDSEQIRFIQLEGIKQMSQHYTILNLMVPKDYQSLWHCIKYNLKRIIYKNEHLQEKWDDYAMLENNTKSLQVAEMHDAPFKCFQNSWFGNGVMAKFEGRDVRIPQDYDSYLSCLYGDYMTPPPIDKRNSVHSYFYVNYEKRISGRQLSNIKKEIRKKTKYIVNINKEWQYIKQKLNL